MTERFGNLLRHLRKEAGRTMGDLADYLNVSVVYVSEVERANRPPFTERRIVAASEYLAPYLDRSADDVAGELQAAAAESRGAFELDVSNASERAKEIGAALMRGWPLTDEQLEEIAQVVLPRESTKNED